MKIMKITVGFTDKKGIIESQIRSLFRRIRQCLLGYTIWKIEILVPKEGFINRLKRRNLPCDALLCVVSSFLPWISSLESIYKVSLHLYLHQIITAIGAV